MNRQVGLPADHVTQLSLVIMLQVRYEKKIRDGASPDIFNYSQFKTYCVTRVPNRCTSSSYLKTACLSKNVIFIWIYSK
jgi:hypothetical protein